MIILLKALFNAMAEPSSQKQPGFVLKNLNPVVMPSEPLKHQSQKKPKASQTLHQTLHHRLRGFSFSVVYLSHQIHSWCVHEQKHTTMELVALLMHGDDNALHFVKCLQERLISFNNSEKKACY